MTHSFLQTFADYCNYNLPLLFENLLFLIMLAFFFLTRVCDASFRSANLLVLFFFCFQLSANSRKKSGLGLCVDMWTHVDYWMDVQSTSCHVIKRQTLHKQFQIDYLPLQIKIKSLSLSNGQAE